MTTSLPMIMETQQGREWLDDQDHWGLVLDSLPDAVAIVAPDGTIVFANRQLHRLSGYRPDELVGRSVEVLVPEGHRGQHQAHRQEYRDRPKLRPMGAGLEISCQRSDGSTFPADISLAPVTTPEGLFTVCVVRDGTDRRRTEEELFYKAVHDPLTGLANRSLLLDRLAHRLRASGRTGTAAGLFYLDVDYFKLVNDRFGHGAGDRVLCALARRMEGVVREGDTVARFGGDEFVVLCEELTDAGAAEEIAYRFVDEAAQPIEVDGVPLEVSVSVGVAIGRAGTVTAEALLGAADKALYEAKATGRNRYVLAADRSDDESEG